MAAYRTALKEARASYDKARDRLIDIEVESRTLNEEVAKLKRTITALAAMCSESPNVDKLGITDACVEAIQLFHWPVSTSEVVIGLDTLGFDMQSQKNANASVHAILSRLAKDGKIKKIEEKDQPVKWLGPNAQGEFEVDEEIPF